MKNISAQEITVAAEELTERFVRGDSSRNTEGKNVYLSITYAKIMSRRMGKEFLQEFTEGPAERHPSPKISVHPGETVASVK